MLGLRAIARIFSGEISLMVVLVYGMDCEDNFSLRLDLAVLHCGYFQIQMGQLYP